MAKLRTQSLELYVNVYVCVCACICPRVHVREREKKEKKLTKWKKNVREKARVCDAIQSKNANKQWNPQAKDERLVRTNTTRYL